MKRFVCLCFSVILLLSFTACNVNDSKNPSGQTPNTELDARQIYEQFGQVVSMPQMLALNEALMLDYCGIIAADVKQAIVAICADSLRTDEIWLVEATDEAAAERIVALANARLTKKGEESITYSPQQYAVVEKAELIQTGNFIALIVSPDVEALTAAFRQVAGLAA